MNDNILREIAKKFTINFDALNKIEEYNKTINYLENLDYSQMPDSIKDMNKNLLKSSEDLLEKVKCDFIIKEKTDNENQIFKNLELLKDFPKCKELYFLEEESISYNLILNSNLEIVSSVYKKIEDLLQETKTKYNGIAGNLYNFLDKIIRNKFLGETTKEEEIKSVAKDISTKIEVKKRDYFVKKSNLSNDEVRQLILDFIGKNEAIFNKIIFESKAFTLSISDRIIDVYFKPNIGYIINFVSEPDTNYGKFYQNLLKVFKEIKEQLYDKHQILVVPEEGKGLTYLNSFYQNYIFVREKIDSILIKYKLQKSLLNEVFSIHHLIFDKLKNQYLVFYTGNINLKNGVLNYLQNQAKLGPVEYELVFIEFNMPINKHITTRYFKQKNHVDLKSENNYFKVSQISTDANINSLFVTMSDVNLLLEPFNYENDSEKMKNILGTKKIDIIILPNASHKNIIHLPRIMKENPDAKLFASDITYKIARIKWLSVLNSANFNEENSKYQYSKKDIDTISERIIKITPKGKGYNFRSLINIKFFNGGKFPGASIVELRDASKKILLADDFLTTENSLLKGAAFNPADYDYIILAQNKFSQNQENKLNIHTVDEYLTNGKQVFVFCNSFGNLQHITQEFYKNPKVMNIYSGDHTFDIVNKELGKVISFGSSWADNFVDKECFSNSIEKINKFDDEYEFYKRFSSDTPAIFLMPYGKEEIDMVIKNKLEQGNLLCVQEDYAQNVDNEIKDYLAILPSDTIAEVKPLVFNNIFSESDDNLKSLMNSAKQILLLNGQEESNYKNVKNLPQNKALSLY